MRAEIECGICKKVFECEADKSPDECAEKNDMVILSFKDLRYLGGYSEQIYVCRECFNKFIFGLFFPDQKSLSTIENIVINYFKNLNWQEQDELLRKINEVLVNKIF